MTFCCVGLFSVDWTTTKWRIVGLWEKNQLRCLDHNITMKVVWVSFWIKRLIFRGIYHLIQKNAELPLLLSCERYRKNPKLNQISNDITIMNIYFKLTMFWSFMWSCYSFSTLTQSLRLGHYLRTLLTQGLTLGYGINTKYRENFNEGFNQSMSRKICLYVCLCDHMCWEI